MEQQGTERRKYDRFEINRLIWLCSDDDQYVWVEALDLSSDGFRARIDQPIRHGCSVQATLQLIDHDGSKTIETEGWVVRAYEADKGWEFVVRFSRVSSVDQRLLDAWLANLPPEVQP